MKLLSVRITVLLFILFLFLFSPFITSSTKVSAQSFTASSNCVLTVVGKPSANAQLPTQCQNTSITCNNVSEIDNIPYTDPSNQKISVTVWNCDHAAPLVIFIPGRGRSAADYAQYEKAIANAGFTVAGVNFGNVNDGGHFTEEANDVSFLITKLNANTQLKISPGSVGLVGHSDGGVVVLMEGYLGKNDPSIKAIVSADGATPGQSSGPPLLLLHGSNDQLDPTPPNLGSYNANPKYHAEITGADHFCYVAEKSVPGYGIDCETAGLQNQTQALDAITGAFLQLELLGCGSSVSSVADQYKNYITLQQSGNTGNATPCSSGVVGGLTNPFPGGWEPNRLDMGYDGTFKGQIVAPFAGTITYAATGVATWGGYLEITATQKPAGLPTATIYFAEGISPLVHTGDTVTAGQKIAQAVPNSVYNGIVGNIEFGVSQNGPGYVNTYCIALGCGHCPQATAASKAMVLNFAKWTETNFHLAPPSATDEAGCA